jgi:aspartate racemase
LIPDESDRLEVSRIIYKELVSNIVLDSSKSFYLDVIAKLKEKGAEGIIMGCTEIPLMIKKDDTKLILFDTNKILADATLEYALN